MEEDPGEYKDKKGQTRRTKGIQEEQRKCKMNNENTRRTMGNQ